MKRFPAILILAASAGAQVQTIPNTAFPAVRTLLNSNFSWLNANKAGTGACAAGTFGVQTTTGGIVCLAVDWSVVTGIPSTFAPAAHAASHASAGTDPITPAAIGAESTANKGVNGGYLGIGADGSVTMRATILGPKTIGAGASQLPAASACSGCITIVTDAASGSDCTVGGGSSVSLCRSNGSVWAALGGGSASLPGVTISTTSPVTVSAASGFWYNDSAGAMTFTLPTITSGDVGMQLCFRNYTARTGALTIQAPVSTYIDWQGGNGTAAGTLVSTGNLADGVCVVATSTTQYIASPVAGSWTNN